MHRIALSLFRQATFFSFFVGVALSPMGLVRGDMITARYVSSISTMTSGETEDIFPEINGFTYSLKRKWADNVRGGHFLSSIFISYPRGAFSSFFLFLHTGCPNAIDFNFKLSANWPLSLFFTKHFLWIGFESEAVEKHPVVRVWTWAELCLLLLTFSQLEIGLLFQHR